jgi:hypothetical protein
MRPDDRRANFGLSAGDGAADVPLDAVLAALDDELQAAGAQAGRALRGRTQPTRDFSNRLRDRLLGTVAAPGAVSTPSFDGVARPEPMRAARLRLAAVAGETWAPAPLQPRLARRTPTVLPRARWALIVAATLTTMLVAGALGARFEWPVPAPTSDASRAPVTVSPDAPSATPLASSDAVLPAETAQPTLAVTPAPAVTPAATPKPTPTRKLDATPKPAPTTTPIGPMDLLAKACPGGVILDWTKPSPEVAHYHVLRSIGGEVPATYPADGTTEVETATTWSAGATDGFDAGLDGGAAATYRAFAFGAEDQVLATSPSRTVTTVAARSLGALSVEALGPGSIAVSWGASEVPAACFSYGKLVVSADDPDPSYLKGSTYLTAIGDQATTSVVVNELPSLTTVWMRYELIRSTGTGAFVVGRTEVLKVTYP